MKGIDLLKVTYLTIRNVPHSLVYRIKQLIFDEICTSIPRTYIYDYIWIYEYVHIILVRYEAIIRNAECQRQKNQYIELLICIQNSFGIKPVL